MIAAVGGATPATAAPLGAPAIGLRVHEVVRETADAASLVFDVPSEHAAGFDYVPGQYIEVEIPWQGMHLRRCYSLSSTPRVDRYHAVTVKRVAQGRVSNWLLDNVQAGDTLRCVAPDGDFVSRPAAEGLRQSEAPMLAFAAGSGITPVYSLVKAALLQSERSVRLVYANRDVESEIFAAALADLQRAYAERFELLEHFDRADGLLAPSAAQAHARSMSGVEQAEVFLCGPAPFMAMVESALEAVGVRPQQLHIERFISRTDPDRADEPDCVAEQVPKTLSVTLKGKRHHLDYVAGESVLQTCKRHGIDAPRSCEDGYCGSCMAVLKYGDPDLGRPRALSEADLARGRVLTCQLRPASAVPFAVTYDEADFRRTGDGDLSTDAPRISRWRAMVVILLLTGAAIGLRLLRDGL